MEQSEVVVRHPLAQKLFTLCFSVLFLLATLSSPVYGQSASSAQAYYGSTQGRANLPGNFQRSSTFAAFYLFDRVSSKTKRSVSYTLLTFN
jgi:hypothetical protein